MASMLRSRLQDAHDIARRHLDSAAKRSKDIYDTKLAVNTYNIGDLVWYLAETRKVGAMLKLECLYEGPYLIKEKYNDTNFVFC